jgi:hypothetical protein
MAKPTGSAFESLMNISRATAEAGSFEVAYHALAAAMHAAELEKDLEALDRALDACVTQHAMIESISPPHPLSKAGAEKRHTVPLYDSLLRTIESTRNRISTEIT